MKLLETCWRVRGPSGRVLACTIHRSAFGLEVRCGYGELDLLRSQMVPDIGTGRELAAEWRAAVVGKSGFSEVP